MYEAGLSMVGLESWALIRSGLAQALTKTHSSR